jgi:hypothetical protein
MQADPTPIALDENTVAFYLTVENSQIVVFQAIVESYEGLGSVRTVDVGASLVSIIAPKDQLNDCQRVLRSLKKEVPWTCAADRYVPMS